MAGVTCRSCGTANITEVISLGSMPPVNAFPDAGEVDREKSYPLDVFYCHVCTLVQLGDIVPPEELFSQYLHLSAASQSNIRHLQTVVETVKRNIGVDSASKILEIGSNDGSLLSQFLGAAGTVLGVDPARNLVEVSAGRRVETLPMFFSRDAAADITGTRGHFDIVIALNVVAHTPDLNDLFGGVHAVLSPNGTFMFEAAYVGDTILQGAFDTIYHEHVYCFSLHAASAALERADLVVVDAEKIPTQGGSIRIFARRKENSPVVSDRVAALLEWEKANGLTDVRTYESLGDKAQKLKRDLLTAISDLKKNGKLIGLGAPARGVVLLNYCGIGPKDIAYVIDDTPLKQGRFVPGRRIPVRAWEELKDHPANAFLMLSWNYRDEILKKLGRYVTSGSVIIPFPSLHAEDLGG